MTDFQKEVLKERERISFHYDKSDINVQVIEEEENNIIKNYIKIKLEYSYYFDSSQTTISDIQERFLNNELLSDKYELVKSITPEDFSFKHEVHYKICLHELKKNKFLKDLSSDEVAEYIQEKIYSKEFKDLVFNIGIIEGFSYYKLIPVQNFIITGELNESQKKWWAKLLYNGLGEYRYLNNLLSIKEEEFIHIISNQKLENFEEKTQTMNYLNIEKQGFLIPIGGGKDSVVTLELLSKFRDENTLFAIDLKGARLETAEVAGYLKKEIVQVTRKFDTKLKERNEQGFFNGHVPFSATIAFTSMLAAYILNKQYIPLSNESSASEPTVVDLDINHQYSKAIEFEIDFREYIEQLGIDIEYFSLLRPLTEVGIAKMFSRYEKYFNAFNSCNVGSKGENWHWCCDCPKCLFAYIVLAPFLYRDKLVSIFGKDVFDNPSLLEDMYKLIGKRDVKPFECVGTRSETVFSLNELMKKLKVKDMETNTNTVELNGISFELPILLQKYREIYLNEESRVKSKLEQKEAESTVHLDEHNNLYLVYSYDNFLPEFLEEIVKQAIQEEE